MWDALDILRLADRKKGDDRKQRFTFEWLAAKVIRRQKAGKDSIIIISGERRGGKSNWMLKFVRAYIKLKRLDNPSFKWSWDRNFVKSRKEAMDASRNLERSFICYDEGGDEFFSTETLNRAARQLVKFMNKDGSKLNLKIIIWPDIFTLDQKVTNMAHLLVLIPYRYCDIDTGYGCAWAFINGRNPNPLTYDKFGIQKIKKKLEAPTKMGSALQLASMDGVFTVIHDGKKLKIPYPKYLFRFLRSLPTFMLMHRFLAVDKRFEDMYIRKVKEPALKRDDDADRYVTIGEYKVLKMKDAALLYNLKHKMDMSWAQLERLHISPVDGTQLRSIESIKRIIRFMEARTEGEETDDRDEEDTDGTVAK